MHADDPIRLLVRHAPMTVEQQLALAADRALRSLLCERSELADEAVDALLDATPRLRAAEQATLLSGRQLRDDQLDGLFTARRAETRRQVLEPLLEANTLSQAHVREASMRTLGRQAAAMLFEHTKDRPEVCRWLIVAGHLDALAAALPRLSDEQVDEVFDALTGFDPGGQRFTTGWITTARQLGDPALVDALARRPAVRRLFARVEFLTQEAQPGTSVAASMFGPDLVPELAPWRASEASEFDAPWRMQERERLAASGTVLTGLVDGDVVDLSVRLDAAVTNLYGAQVARVAIGAHLLAPTSFAQLPADNAAQLLGAAVAFHAGGRQDLLDLPAFRLLRTLASPATSMKDAWAAADAGDEAVGAALTEVSSLLGADAARWSAARKLLAGTDVRSVPIRELPELLSLVGVAAGAA